MNWEYASAGVKKELGYHPRFPDAVEIKSNPVRSVCRSGDYFIKEDRRKGRRLRREFNSARLLKEAGLPVVEYLALGEGEGKSVLITRAFPGESVGDYYYKTFVRDGADPEHFLVAFAAFVRRVLESRIYHPDFHVGNILYSPETGEFVLVDVYGVRKRNLFDRIFLMHLMRRIPLELREIVNNRRMIRLIADCGIPRPEKFWKSALRREAEYLFREWPKRKRQILNGYPKFTVRENGLLRTVDPVRELMPLEGCRIATGNPDKQQALYLEMFFNRLARLPYYRIAAFNPQNGAVYIVPEESQLRLESGDLAQRLLVIDRFCKNNPLLGRR